VVWPPLKAQTHSFFLSFFLAFQGGRTTSKGLGVVWPPQKPKPILSFFLSFWPFGVARPPQAPRDGFGHSIPVVGGLQPLLGQKYGGPATSFLGKGVAGATLISFIPFLFFFYFFLILSFFFKKKKLKS
jgi:hypothetical protein